MHPAKGKIISPLIVYRILTHRRLKAWRTYARPRAGTRLRETPTSAQVLERLRINDIGRLHPSAPRLVYPELQQTEAVLESCLGE
jgi:hypothetical protein